MTDPDEPFRRDMHQETSEEFFSGESDFFPLPLVFIIFGGKSNGTVSHSFDSVVADCDPMGIFPQVQNHGFRPVKRLLAVWHPFFAVLQPYQIILASSSFFIVFVFCNKRPAILLNGCCRGQILFITAKYNLFHSFFFAH